VPLALLHEEWQEAHQQDKWLGCFLFSSAGKRPSQHHNFVIFFCTLSLTWGLYASGVAMKVDNPNNAAQLGINIIQADISFAVKLLL